MDEATKKLIDGMSYATMLQRWRFAPVGDPMFQGASGDYFSAELVKKRARLTGEERVAVSKSVGWE